MIPSLGRWFRDYAGPGAVVLAAAVLMFFGWRLFWFLTDDAFIAFRYVHNELAGHGFVYNPSPFRPVEGYTSFSWVVLLDLVWRLTGVEPPNAANWLSLVFGYLTLGIVSLLLFRLDLPQQYRRLRTLLVALALAGILSNRTFLAWLSSGLETSLFNFLLSSWVALFVLRSGAPSLRNLWLSVLCAVALALTRPDGLLFCAATGAWLIWCVWTTRQKRLLWCATPFALVLLHLLWRFHTYGVWLPNSYYAKYSGVWPESGARYLASFFLEYALVIPLGLWLVALVKGRAGATPATRWALVTLAAHAAYYTFVIGGDHFEYRVYSHLVPWLWLATLALSVRVLPQPRHGLAVVAAALVLSLPIPWVHWLRTHDRLGREETEHMVAPIAWAFPQPFGAVVQLWDDWQGWLIDHYVCMRHQEHKVFGALQRAKYPVRQAGLQMAWDEHNVYAMNTVGVPGWALPNAALIDTHGLNDFVIARTPPDRRVERHMAHDRWPPPGYVACFEPNVTVEDGRIILRRRALNSARIRSCEESFARGLPRGP